MKNLLILIALSQLPLGCGWFKGKKKSKDSGETQAAENLNPILNPEKIPVGSESTAASLALAQFAPNMTHACAGQLDSIEYQAIVDQLGGINFTAPLRFFRNEAEPYLQVPYEKPIGGYSRNEMSDQDNAVAGSAEASDAKSAAPDDSSTVSVDIKRADLIGQSGTKVIFLSKTHGLFMVETAGDSPKMSCTVMVPGAPKNFYIKDNHLILVANHRDTRSASSIIVYEISAEGLKYKSHLASLDAQILDSRLFNNTLVTYSRSFPKPKTVLQTDGGASGAVANDSVYSSSQQEQKYVVTAYNQLTEKPAIVFEDLLVSDFVETSFAGGFAEKDLGAVVSSRVNYKDFISASDKYFVVTKQVSETFIARIENRRSTYRFCSNYNPKAHLFKHNYCKPIYEKVSNPEFDPDFSCHSDVDFAGCVNANETKFVKSYWNFKGKQCQEHQYWRGRCEAYESKTVEQLVPVYESRTTSQLAIYQFDGDNFVRLDDPAGAEPFVVPGSIKEHKSFQFQDGYLFVISNERAAGTSLISYKMANKALVRAASVDGMGPREDLKAVLFADDYAYVVTFLRKDPLFRISLKDPANPVLEGQLDVPGFSSQLISYQDKLIGIGSNAEWRSQKVKVSLFNVAPDSFLSEIDSLDLGPELERSFNSSATDDQLHHFVPSSGRLYVPFSGTGLKSPEETFSKVCPANFRYPKHQLSVFHVGENLGEEATLNFRGSIERVKEFSLDSAIAFSTGSVNYLKKSADGFSNESIRDLFQTEGIYKDAQLPGGMVVAKQVVRAGGQLYKMRFVMGTKEQVVKGEAPHVLEISDDLVSCLGSPQLRFFDNQMLFGHNLNHVREGYANPNDQLEISISGRLGWKMTTSGFEKLGDADVKLLSERKIQICELNAGTGAPEKWEEVQKHLQDVGQYYSCREEIAYRGGGRIINP